MTTYFQIFDQDGSGFVDRKELGKVLTRCGKFKKKELDELFDAMDENKDGLIDYEGIFNQITSDS